MRKALIAGVSAVALALGFGATAGAQEEDPGTIVDIASSNEDFSTLVTSVTEAGLVDTLSGEGPFTVFAPTNAAFEALPAGTLDSLLADPQGALTDVLSLHVMSGEVNSEAAIAAAGTNVETLGGPVAVALDGDNLTVGGATVVTTDIEASNGVIHVIDAVITEPASSAAPEAINAGTSGVATDAGVNSLLLALVGGIAVLGIGTGSLALARARRED
jgi:uncharacterized surface protein with fasciclin (FAS1) repeats